MDGIRSVLIKDTTREERMQIVAKESELVKYLLDGFEEDPSKIWESNIFGKPLNDIAAEGLNSKIRAMPEDAQGKLRMTIQRIINEGSGGLICIIL